jgi:hypothetical protein
MNRFDEHRSSAPPPAEPGPQPRIDPAALDELRRYCAKYSKRAHITLEGTGQITLFLEDPEQTGHAIDLAQRRAKGGWLAAWQK